MQQPIPQSRTETNYLEDCLIFLSRHFDLHVSRASIQSGLVGEEAELSPDQFGQAAERAGMASRILAVPLHEINDNDLPLIVLLNDGKAIVLVERLLFGAFAAHDPDFGSKEIKITIPEMETSYTGDAILVRPIVRPSETSADRKLTDARHWFWAPFRENKKTYIQVAVAAAMTNMFGLATSLFIMVVYDRVVPNNATESLIALTVGIAIVIIFDFIIKSLRASFIDHAGKRADMAMGQRIFNQILEMQLKSRKGSTGAIANMLREFEVLRDFITSASLVAIVDMPFIIMFIYVINVVAGPLALVPAVIVPVVIVVGLVIQPLLAHLAEEAYGQTQEKQSVIVETLYGLETIKSIGAAPMMRKRWQDAVAANAEQGSKSRRVTQFAMNFTGMAQQSAQVLVVFYGVFLIAEGRVTMGAMIASVILIGRVVGPLAQLAQTMTRINQTRVSFKAIDEFMKAPTERMAGRSYVSRPTLEGKIEFKNVTFKYPDQVGNALENVSFTINAGEKVAVLGRIGSGKSTLAKLILGLYDPDEGAIFIDGTDIRQIDPSDLRRNVGYTQQEVFLFTGSVRQNIAIGGRRPTDEQVLEASIVAGVHDFISQHPNGYDLTLRERGEGLSGGQKQAIAIARTLVDNPPILVMDEPTSSMDNQTESALLARLKVWAADKTFLGITHRTSILSLVDRIIVLDEGSVIADSSKDVFLENQKTQREQQAQQAQQAQPAAPAAPAQQVVTVPTMPVQKPKKPPKTKKSDVRLQKKAQIR